MTSSELNKLQRENRILAEELAQCQADKEFVWSLWKRLQVANPDITQTIGLVVQREKEKAELKDRKVLEILQVKDDRIAELERLLSQQEEEVKSFVSRTIKLDDEAKVLLKANTNLKERQQQLEDLIQSKDSRLKNTEDISKERTEELQDEKNDCEQTIKSLSRELKTAKKELNGLQTVRTNYQSKIKDLEKDLENITQTAEKAATEEDLKSRKLNDAEGKLRKFETDLINKGKTLDERERVCAQLRTDLTSLHVKCDQAMAQSRDKTDVIQQLQTLQFDTQKVLKNMEDSHKAETSSFQTMYQELQSRYQATKTSEQRLRQQVISSKERLSLRRSTKESSTQADLVADAVPTSGRGGRQRNATRRSRSLSPGRTRTKLDPPERVNGLAGELSELVDEEEDGLRGLDTGTGDHRDRRIADLRKILKLKATECDEMRTAHTRRLERLKALQASHNVLKQQIATYDAQERNPPKKSKSRRSEPRSLQREDSDSVWNELAYFKQQTVNVLQERMNLHEELDCLRVQTASDAVTIDELTRCLQHERQELEEQHGQLEEVGRRKKDERDAINILRDKVTTLKRSLQRLDQEKVAVSHDKARIEADNRSLRMTIAKQRASWAQRESKMLDLRRATLQLKKKLRRQRRWQRHTVGALPSKTVKEHEMLLNRSIQEMSSILPGYEDDEDWEEMDCLSPPLSTSQESLGQHIIDTSRSSQAYHTPRSSQRSPTTRQLASVRKHLRRMAQAYEDQPVREVILQSVATQTERVLESTRMGAGDGLVTMMSTSTMTDDTTATESTVSTQSDTDWRDVGTSPHIPLTRLAGSIKRRAQCKGTGLSVASLKQRVASLQKQVSLLKEAKICLQGTQGERDETIEQLQTSLNLATQRNKSTRQTILRLTGELEESNQQRALLKKQRSEGETEYRKRAETERRQAEGRLKTQSGEISRQASVIQSLKNELDLKAEIARNLREKVNRQERDISQKRSLIEELKVKSRCIDGDNKAATRATELLEDKIKSLTEAGERRKTEVDSLRKQASVASTERRRYEQLLGKTKSELDRKVKALSEAHAKLGEAEAISSELEATAGQQFNQLATQTQVALEAARSKLNKTQSQSRELQAFTRMLASNLIQQIQEIRRRIRQPVPPPASQDARNGSMSRAQGIASSILNMSASDLDEFMTSCSQDGDKNHDEQVQDGQWSTDLEAALSSKVPNSNRLLELFLKMISERDKVQQKENNR